MRIKKVVGKLHLWLGFITGPLVFVIAITGCIYAFQEEIQNATQPYRFVEEENKNFLPPSVLVKAAQKKLPHKKVHSVTYGLKSETAKVSFYAEGYYDVVYTNPYNAKVLCVKDMNSNFFQWILRGHFYLWIPPPAGQIIVATATLIFTVILISGLILWWPRNRAARKQRFIIKWKFSWKRRNYDLHNVLGFYAFIFAFVLAFTGLVWGFKWFASSVYYVTSGGKKMTEYYEPKSDTLQSYKGEIIAYDYLWKKLCFENSNYKKMEVHIPENDSSSINISINPSGGTYWKTSYRYFDQYTLKELEVNHTWGKYEQANTAQKIQRLNYDVHVGSIGGIVGKIFVFLLSLLIASLPITGFIIWWGKRKRVIK